MKAWKRRYATKKVPCDFCGDKHIFSLKTAAKEWSPENQDEPGRVRPFHRNLSDSEFIGPNKEYPDDTFFVRPRSPVPWDSEITSEDTTEGAFHPEDRPKEVSAKSLKALKEGFCPHCKLKFKEDEQLAAFLPERDRGNIGSCLPRHFRCFKDVINACPAMRSVNSQAYDPKTKKLSPPPKKNGINLRSFTLGTYTELKPKVHEHIKKIAAERENLSKSFPNEFSSEDWYDARDWVTSQDPKTGSWEKRYKLASEICDCGDQLNVAL